jgi:hypothetical protein
MMKRQGRIAGNTPFWANYFASPVAEEPKKEPTKQKLNIEQLRNEDENNREFIGQHSC